MTIVLPIHTVSETNQRGHWAIGHRRHKSQREAVWVVLRGHVPPKLPCTITLTRLASKLLDTDNLPPSLKAVTDGVSDWIAGEYGKGQDRQPGLAWQYSQRKQRKYGVEMTIEQGEATP